MLPKALIWLRRDLRLEDHTPLAHAEQEGFSVALAFVFDRKILQPLPATDRRVPFFHAALEEIDEELRARGSRLLARVGDPVKEIPELARTLGASHVFASRDYEPGAIRRDEAVASELRKNGIELRLFKDQVIFERDEILNGQGAPYKVFTAYKNAWLAKARPADAEVRGRRLPELLPAPTSLCHRWDLATLGFRPQKLWLEPGAKAAKKRLRAFGDRIGDYDSARNVPSIEGTSGLSAHLRFGTISVRACARLAGEKRGRGAATWLSELVWRDFYFMILSLFPQIGRGEAFRPEYETIEWPGTEAHFRAWCAGSTGFPLVDAAMRLFNDTGWMHNRLRMVVASFLTKDLLVDWRKGEAYFARGLLDFDLAANNGGWQWSASTGCDAQPYFRIFNPTSQSKKFDPDGTFLRTHLPELRGLSDREIHEPRNPIVDHSTQRAKALALFKK
jgi:deoxyribodipyrimidine photo-lyase